MRKEEKVLFLESLILLIPEGKRQKRVAMLISAPQTKRATSVDLVEAKEENQVNLVRIVCHSEMP